MARFEGGYGPWSVSLHVLDVSEGDEGMQDGDVAVAEFADGDWEMLPTSWWCLRSPGGSSVTRCQQRSM